MSSQEITWNLTELFSSLTDPKIEEAITQATTMANDFEKKYHGKITSLSADGLLQCIQAVEAFGAQFSDITLYSNLAFSAEMTQPKAQALHDRVEKLNALLSKKLAFYSLELGKLVKAKPELMEEPALANYRHMLQRVHRRVEHQLSEVEEQLIIEKDQFGVNAWEELQSKWLNTRLFEVTVLGEKKDVSYGEANGLLPPRSGDTRIRQSLYYGLLGKDRDLLSALRSICNDWVAVSERRKYLSPMESSLISNDTEQAIVDACLEQLRRAQRLSGLPQA